MQLSELAGICCRPLLHQRQTHWQHVIPLCPCCLALKVCIGFSWCNVMELNLSRCYLTAHTDNFMFHSMFSHTEINMIKIGQYIKLQCLKQTPLPIKYKKYKIKLWNGPKWVKATNPPYCHSVSFILELINFKHKVLLVYSAGIKWASSGLLPK